MYQEWLKKYEEIKKEKTPNEEKKQTKQSKD